MCRVKLQRSNLPPRPLQLGQVLYRGWAVLPAERGGCALRHLGSSAGHPNLALRCTSVLRAFNHATARRAAAQAFAALIALWVKLSLPPKQFETTGFQ
jgi:hypothetical protein